MITEKLKTWWQSRNCYVIADPTDNSVTLSKALFNHIRSHAREGGAARVFVFRVAGRGTFGFALDPDIGQAACLCDIQYNGKYRSVGFESLCPSVGWMFYEYGLPAVVRAKLSVSVRRAAGGLVYYQIEKPNGKPLRKHKEG